MDFILRPWTLNDLNSLVSFANNPGIAKNMTDQFPYPYNAINGRTFIDFATRDTPARMFAIEIEGKAAGGIGLHPQHDIQRKNAELGYWLAEPYWGKGIMTEAIVRMTDYGFEQLEDIERIFARPFGTNTGSQRALEKAGFAFEARFHKTFFKHGEYIDELYYAVWKDQWKSRN